MALRQLVINKRMNTLKSQLESTGFEELNKRASELEKAIEEAETEEDLKIVSVEAEKIEEEREKIKKEIAKLEAEIKALEEELVELEDKVIVEQQEENKGERKNMGKQAEYRNSLNAFVRGKKIEDRNLTTVEGGIILPKEVIPVVEEDDNVDLSKHVTVEQVSHGAGSRPLIGLTDEVMVTVDELEQNPKLGNPTFKDVDYKVATYRGYIPVSQEMIDDADFDVTDLVVKHIKNIELNTKNAQILVSLKAATAKAVEGVDGLKALLNVTLPRKYGRTAIISSSLFNALDTVKDANGRYLLQDDVKAETGKNLLGMKLEILDDKVIGTAEGDMVGFFGDAKRAVALFDRKQVSVKWVDHNIYGQLLAGFTRFQVKSVDEDAGFFVTFTPTPEA